MNYWDKEIEKVLKKAIVEPIGYEQMILNTIKNTEKKKNNSINLIKKLVTVSASILITCSGVLATSLVYDKVWKNPEKYNYSEESKLFSESQIDWNSNLMSKDELINKATEILKVLGYNDYHVETTEIFEIKNKQIINNYCKIIAKNQYEKEIIIKLKADNSNLMYFSSTDIKLNQATTESIEQTEAINNINEIAQNLNLSEYQLNVCKESNVVYENINTIKWLATFNKKIDNIINPYENLTITFLKKDNNFIVTEILVNEDWYFENNPVSISEEVAIKTATTKEKEFNNLNIDKVDATLGIRRMNTFIYELENNVDRANIDITKPNAELYKTETRTRKVWIVSIEHNDDILYNDHIEFLRKSNKKYYIDATTGEIIGGMDNVKSESPIY